MLEGARREWRCFRDDTPGQRFSNHHRREHRSSSKAARILRVVVGAVLIAGGVVMLFIPGPGLLAILFGVALVAGESNWLASRMDRVEVWARRSWRRLRNRIRRNTHRLIRRQTTWLRRLPEITWLPGHASASDLEAALRTPPPAVGSAAP